jgi:hypothetical protein
MAYSFPLQLYRLASDPELVDTYNGGGIGETYDDIVKHDVDLGLGLRVVLNALSDDKLLDVPSIVQLTVNIAQHLKNKVNLPLGLEQNIEASVHRMKQLSRTIFQGRDLHFQMLGQPGITGNRLRDGR